MAQYYTLDEASRKVGLSVDEFRKRLATEWKSVRRFPDGATLRFQAREIDELARKLGRGSEPDLQLGEAPLKLAEEPAPTIGKSPGKASDQTILLEESSDDFVPLAMDDDVHAPSPPKDKKSGSDSDVKLEAPSAAKPLPGSEQPTEVLGLADEPAPSKPGSDKHKKKQPIHSEFELNLSDSDDFDLQLSDDGSDEVAIGGSASPGGRGDSGINLREPADSGISLEKDSSEFELQLEPEAGSPLSTESSSSEFELSLDDSDEKPAHSPAANGGDQKDIFETDFELPAIDDSGSQDEQAELDTDLSDSDFDLSIDEEADEESGSEVVAVDEDDDAVAPLEDEDQAVAVAPAVAAAPAKWGAFPLTFLTISAPIMLFGMLMSFELLRDMWGYHTGNKVSTPIVRLVAGWFGNVPD